MQFDPTEAWAFMFFLVIVLLVPTTFNDFENKLLVGVTTQALISGIVGITGMAKITGPQQLIVALMYVGFILLSILAQGLFYIYVGYKAHVKYLMEHELEGLDNLDDYDAEQLLKKTGQLGIVDYDLLVNTLKKDEKKLT